MQTRGKLDRIMDKSIFLFVFFLPFLPPASYVALLVALALWFRKENLRKILYFEPRIFGWALLGFLIAVGLSVTFSIDRTLSFGAFTLFIFYLLSCILIAGNVRNEGRAQRILAAAILSGVVITVFGIVQYLARVDFDYKIGFLTISLHAKEGLGSTLGNPNKFAKYLDLILPLSFVSLLVQKPLKRKILPGVVLILGLVCLVFSRSLGGMAAVFAVIMVILLIKNWKVFLVVIIGLFIFSFFNHALITKTILKYGTPSRRIYTWKEVVPRIFKSYPLLGSGLGTYKLVSGRERPGKEWIVDTTNSYEETRSMQATVAWSWLWQDVPVEAKKYYTLSAWVRSDIVPSKKTGDGNTFLTLECLNDENEVIAREWGVASAGPSWVLKKTHIYAPRGTQKIRIKLAKRQGQGSVWFDDLRLIESFSRSSKGKRENTLHNPGFELLDELGKAQSWRQTPGRYTALTAHSLYFDYLCELGVVGLASLLLVIAIFFYSSIRYLRRHSFLAVGGIIGGCSLSILAALIHGTVETFLDVFRVGLLFWVIIGLAMGLLRLHFSRQEKT
ncbi:MAG: O-antigen ligase family protein [bacterium]